METPTKEDIIRMSHEIAKEVIDAVRADRLIYHEPASVRDGIQESMSEEVNASMWYQLRAKNAAENGDHKSANLYLHIAGQENHHYDELNKRLIELSGG